MIHDYDDEKDEKDGKADRELKLSLDRAFSIVDHGDCGEDYHDRRKKVQRAKMAKRKLKLLKKQQRLAC